MIVCVYILESVRVVQVLHRVFMFLGMAELEPYITGGSPLRVPRFLPLLCTHTMGYVNGSLRIIVPRNLHGFHGSAIGGIRAFARRF